MANLVVKTSNIKAFSEAIIILFVLDKVLRAHILSFMHLKLPKIIGPWMNILCCPEIEYHFLF